MDITSMSPASLPPGGCKPLGAMQGTERGSHENTHHMRMRGGVTTVQAQFSTDFGDYAEVYEAVDQSRRVVAEKYISELIFMGAQLDLLKRDVEANGAVDNFTQGKQSMLRESPALKSYCALVQRYGDLQKKLADLLPEKKDLKQSQAGQKLADFVARGKK